MTDRKVNLFTNVVNTDSFNVATFNYTFTEQTRLSSNKTEQARIILKGTTYDKTSESNEGVALTIGNQTTNARQMYIYDPSKATSSDNCLRLGPVGRSLRSTNLNNVETPLRLQASDFNFAEYNGGGAYDNYKFASNGSQGFVFDGLTFDADKPTTDATYEYSGSTTSTWIACVFGTTDASSVVVAGTLGTSSVFGARSKDLSSWNGLNVGTEIPGHYKTTLIAPSYYPITHNFHTIGRDGYGYDNVYVTGAILTSSDATLKEMVEDCPLGLNFIRELQPKTYKFKDVYKEGKLMNSHHRTHHGLVAQDIKTAMDNLNIDNSDAGFYINPKDVNPDSNSKCSLRYLEFIAILVKSVQELKATHDNLLNRVITLENNI